VKSAVAIWLAVLCVVLAPPARPADEIGVFETIHESSVSFAETTVAIESSLTTSGLTLHGSHVVRVPEDKHQAKVYVLTSPAYGKVAAAESPRTVSAQVLRIAVYTWGENQKTFVNMANPVAHAMVFYSESSNYDALVTAASKAADEMRRLVSSAVPGKELSIQSRPLRTENHYRRYKGDGPARVMARFRTWRKSQLVLGQDTAENFNSVVDKVAAAIAGSGVAQAANTEGWETVAQIRLRDDAVYIGLSNPFIEDKMVRINSRFRKDGKSDAAPYPGVDHVAALPVDVLIVKDGDQSLILHYGQMWRMQLYFWDSGYRAFTANVGVPGAIANSIEDTIRPHL